MKVIFLEDVPPNARAGDVKDVKAGYGRNFLLPRGLAVLATGDALQRAESLRAEADERRRKEAMEWSEVAEGLAETPIVLTMRAGPTGRLYGSVTPAQISEQISETIGRVVNRRNVRVPAPIREVGEFTVPVRLFEEVSAEVKVVVQSEDGDVEGPVSADEAQAEEDAATADESETDAVDESTEEPAEDPTEETEEDEETSQSSG